MKNIFTNIFDENRIEINKLLAVEIYELISSDVMSKRPTTPLEIKAIERAIPKLFQWHEVALFNIGRLVEWKSEKKGE